MSKSYVIQWKSAINGRTGKGTKLFEREEAQRLADELNQEYPDIQHEPVEANTTEGIPGNQQLEAPEPEPVEPSAAAEQTESVEQPGAGSESPQVTHDPDPALSFR